MFIYRHMNMYMYTYIIHAVYINIDLQFIDHLFILKSRAAARPRRHAVCGLRLARFAVVCSLQFAISG